MKTLVLVINGNRYPLSDAMNRTTLNDAVAMKLAAGFGMKTLKDRLVRWDELIKEAEKDGDDALDDVVILNSLRAMIWVARRYAGERLTFEQASDFPMDEFGLELEGEDDPAEVVDDAPKAPTDSAPADELVAAQ